MADARYLIALALAPLAVPASAQSGGPNAQQLSEAVSANLGVMALGSKCGVLSDLGNVALRIKRAELLNTTEMLFGREQADLAFNRASATAASAAIDQPCSEANKAQLVQAIDGAIIELAARAHMARQAAQTFPWATGLPRHGGLDPAIDGLVGHFAKGPRAAELQAAADRAGNEVESVLAIICPQRSRLPDGRTRACPALTSDEAKASGPARAWLTGAEMLPAVAAALQAGKPPALTQPGTGYARYMPYGSGPTTGQTLDLVVRCEFGDPVIAIAPGAKLADLAGQPRALLRFGDGALLGQVTLDRDASSHLRPDTADAAASASGVEATGDRSLLGDKRGKFIRCA